MSKQSKVIGAVRFRNGNTTTLRADSNSNTGELYMTQQAVVEMSGTKVLLRPSRVSGRNLPRFLAELNEVLNNGEAKWEGERDDAALDALVAYAKTLEAR